MADNRIRVRLSRGGTELEVEGPADDVAAWWDRLWPEVSTSSPAIQQFRSAVSQMDDLGVAVFGEYFGHFRSDISDTDKVLVAASFVQQSEADRVFTTKEANQLLIEQNIKVANASECIRRLTQAKRTFVVSDGRFRVSAAGFEHLQTLKVS